MGRHANAVTKYQKSTVDWPRLFEHIVSLMSVDEEPKPKLKRVIRDLLPRNCTESDVQNMRRRYYSWLNRPEHKKTFDDRRRFSLFEEQILLGNIKACACQNQPLTVVQLDKLAMNFSSLYPDTMPPDPSRPVLSNTANAIPNVEEWLLGKA